MYCRAQQWCGGAVLRWRVVVVVVAVVVVVVGIWYWDWSCGTWDFSPYYFLS